MRGILGALLLFFFSAFVAFGSEKEPLQLVPSSPWNVHYDNDSCALRRAFGPSEQRVVFEIRQFGPSDRFKLSLAASGLTVKSSPRPEAKFDPDAQFTDMKSVSLVLFDSGLKGAIASGTLLPQNDASADDDNTEWSPSEREDRERAITGYTVRGLFDRDFTLVTGQMHSPMGTMRKCTEELLTHWGIDAAAHQTLTAKAKPKNLHAVARQVQEAYPIRMLQQSKSGLVYVRLIIEPDGTPRSCHIQGGTEEKDFEVHACRMLMARAKFDPALNAVGQPIASYWTSSVFFSIP